MVDFLKKPQELGQNVCRKSRSLKMGETCPCHSGTGSSPMVLPATEINEEGRVQKIGVLQIDGQMTNGFIGINQWSDKSKIAWSWGCEGRDVVEGACFVDTTSTERA